MKNLSRFSVFVFFLTIFVSCNSELGTDEPSTGIIAIDINNMSTDYALEMTLQPDGKILIGGVTQNGISNFFVVRLNSNLMLDSSFGNNGILITSITSYNAYFGSFALQSDGKIVVAGYLSNGTGYDIFVVRYDSTGALDNSFDMDGIFTLDVSGSDDVLRSVSIQSDGKILVAGQTLQSSKDVLLIRFNTNGSLDNSFGTSGIVTTDGYGEWDYSHGIKTQSDGKILVAVGHVQSDSIGLFRYDQSGNLDPTFGFGGKAVARFDNYIEHIVWNIELLPDEKIIVTGSLGSGKPIVARFNSNGTLDIPFLSNVYPLLQNILVKAIVGITLQSDGKIVMAGVDNHNMVVIRLNADGLLVNSFSGDGIGTYSSNNVYYDSSWDVCVQNDGMILVCGAVNDYSTMDMTIMKLYPDGTIYTP